MSLTSDCARCRTIRKGFSIYLRLKTVRAGFSKLGGKCVPAPVYKVHLFPILTQFQINLSPERRLFYSQSKGVFIQRTSALIRGRLHREISALLRERLKEFQLQVSSSSRFILSPSVRNIFVPMHWDLLHASLRMSTVTFQ
jgi:hypothetical protein